MRPAAGDAAPHTAPRTPPRTATVRALDPAGFVAAIPGLADLLVDAVDAGAAVNFLAGLTAEQARDWWHERVPQFADGTMTAIVATDDTGRIVGSTVIVRSRNPNAPHRAEIVKVLVHRDARRQGLARRLMATAEEIARADGRWLLILDTHTGSVAETMYRALGWTEFGQVPDHSLLTDGTPSPTTFFWKDLR